MLADLLAKLAPRLDALKAKLEQFGQPPAEKAKAETEPPATVEGRKLAQQAFEEAGATFRRAQVLNDEVSHLERVIGAKRRDIFTHALFERVPSLLCPALWTQLASEWPADIGSMRFLLLDSWHSGADKLTTAEVAVLAGMHCWWSRCIFRHAG